MVTYYKKRNDRKKNIRKAVIEKYGGKCMCCSEAQLEFLVIDHINGGGNKQRKIMSVTKFYKILFDTEINNKDYRVLCHNCNSALGFYGYCPHKERVI